MALELSLREEPQISIEVESLRVESLRELDEDGVKRLTVAQGNRTHEVGDLFHVRGSASDGVVVFGGTTGKLKRIGEGHSVGKIVVRGDAGMHVGARMTGGEIEVEGSTDDWAGAEMRGGLLRIRGRAGDCLGAAYRGARVGMRGGEILVHGSAGDEAGTGMRRGTIAIAGSAGPACGFGLLAGSIVVGGDVGQQLGAGMRRGSILCLQPGASLELLPTFSFACEYSPTYVLGLLRYLEQHGWPVGRRPVAWRRYCGDVLDQGKGEILVAV